MKAFREFHLVKGGRVSIRPKDVSHVATDGVTGLALIVTARGSVYRTKDTYDEVMSWLDGTASEAKKA